MKNFEDLMNDASEMKDIESVELPKEFTENTDSTIKVKEAEETASFADIMNPEKIQMSWSKVNTSGSCGCNNACFNSCYNIG